MICGVNIQFEILGARGGIPVSGPHFQEFGGATSCYKIATDQGFMILDAGTGIVPFGQDLVARGTGEFCVDILFTHAHLDHMQGLPFFAPLYDPRFDIRLWACEEVLDQPLVAVLDRILDSPVCPIRRDHFKACVSFHAIPLAACFAPRPGFKVQAMELTHPGGNVALKVNCAGASVVYSGDFEHGKNAVDTAFSTWLRGVDLAVLDCTYDPDTYVPARGFGHAHWRAVGDIASECKRWVGVHHHHLCDDAKLTAVERDIMTTFPNGGLGREGAVFQLE